MHFCTEKHREWARSVWITYHARQRGYAENPSSINSQLYFDVLTVQYSVEFYEVRELL